jgi:hypothetical protein
MHRVGNSEDLILTLRTPEGQAVSVTMKPWQVEPGKPVGRRRRSSNVGAGWN